MKISEDGVISLTNEDGALIGIVRKDPTSRKNVFYTVSEMSLTELAEMLKNNDIKI